MQSGRLKQIECSERVGREILGVRVRVNWIGGLITKRA